MCRVKDAISLDHLSRLLADVQTDSSEVMEAFISPAQRQMLELVFRGDAENRNKVLTAGRRCRVWEARYALCLPLRAVLWTFDCLPGESYRRERDHAAPNCGGVLGQGRVRE